MQKFQRSAKIVHFLDCVESLIYVCIYINCQNLYSTSSKLLLRCALDPSTAKNNSLFKVRVECVRMGLGRNCSAKGSPRSIARKVWWFLDFGWELVLNLVMYSYSSGFFNSKNESEGFEPVNLP